MKRIVMLNGSPAGAIGNTSIVLGMLRENLVPHAEVRVIHLAERPSSEKIADSLTWAEGFVFGTGTYWDSWGSPLQTFLEQTTMLEASSVWIGKPAAVIVTMHSVGGKEVASRLQGVLTTLGLMIPPMSGFIYSLANQLALEGPETSLKEDLWQLKDLEVVGANLIRAIDLDTLARAHQKNWSAWTVDRADPSRLWLRPACASDNIPILSNDPNSDCSDTE
jgi:NAD(P)H-dependent FMN reductase